MNMTFDDKQLKADVNKLEVKGIPTEAAETIARYKQAVEYSAYFLDSYGNVSEEDVPADVYNKLDEVNAILEDVFHSINELFTTEEKDMSIAG